MRSVNSEERRGMRWGEMWDEMIFIHQAIISLSLFIIMHRGLYSVTDTRPLLLSEMHSTRYLGSNAGNASPGTHGFHISSSLSSDAFAAFYFFTMPVSNPLLLATFFTFLWQQEDSVFKSYHTHSVLYQTLPYPIQLPVPILPRSQHLSLYITLFWSFLCERHIFLWNIHIEYIQIQKYLNFPLRNTIYLSQFPLFFLYIDIYIKWLVRITISSPFYDLSQYKQVLSLESEHNQHYSSELLRDVGEMGKLVNAKKEILANSLQSTYSHHQWCHTGLWGGSRLRQQLTSRWFTWLHFGRWGTSSSS